MELVGNFWPIVDAQSQLILRFAARAYAMDAPDPVISETLKALAPSDFVLARQFCVPSTFTLVTEDGNLQGAVTVANFNSSQSAIIESALRDLETDMPVLHGVGVDAEGEPFHRKMPTAFGKEPYLVVTFLIEDTAGVLHLYSAA